MSLIRAMQGAIAKILSDLGKLLAALFSGLIKAFDGCGSKLELDKSTCK